MGSERRYNKLRGKIIGGAILLTIGLLAAWGAIDLIFSPVSEETPLPEGVPRDIPLLGLGSPQIHNDQQSFIVCYDHKYGATKGVEIYFKEIWSIRGLWSGEGAKLLIPSSQGAVFTGKSKSASWGDTLYTRGGTSSFLPYLETSFVIGRGCFHKWIDAKAELDVVFPSPYSRGYFTSERQHLEQQIKFFVVSPEEHAMLWQHNEWSSEKEIRESPFLKTFTVLSAVSCITGGALLIFGALTKGGWANWGDYRPGV